MENRKMSESYSPEFRERAVSAARGFAEGPLWNPRPPLGGLFRVALISHKPHKTGLLRPSQIP